MIREYGGVVVNVKKKVIIIGGCIAAKEAANAIRSIDSSCTVIMISSEDYLPYYRPMLSRAIGQEVPTSRLCLASKEWYEENNIELILGTKVTQILPDKNIVITDTGNQYEYTHLLLATGASNYIPIPEAMSKKGVLSIRTYDDILKLRECLSVTKKAVVIGGGLLGLETAWELQQQNIDVTIVEFAPHILPKQLEEEAAQFLSLHLEEKGIRLFCNNSITNVLGGKYITAVECSNGETLPCDLLVFSIGAKPNLELTKDTMIATEKGILVDNYMKTNIPNIYAAGDVAQNPHQTSGIWVPAMEMGAIAGYNIADKPSEYAPAHTSTMLTAFDIRVFSIGIITSDSPLITETIIDERKTVFKKLFTKDNIVIGAILIGDISQGTRLAKQLGVITLEDAINLIK